MRNLIKSRGKCHSSTVQTQQDAMRQDRVNRRNTNADKGLRESVKKSDTMESVGWEGFGGWFVWVLVYTVSQNCTKITKKPFFHCFFQINNRIT